MVRNLHFNSWNWYQLTWNIPFRPSSNGPRRVDLVYRRYYVERNITNNHKFDTFYRFYRWNMLYNGVFFLKICSFFA